MPNVSCRFSFRASRFLCALAAVAATLSASAETYTYCGAAGGSAYLSSNNAWKDSSGKTCTIANKGGDYSNVIVFDCAAINTNKIDVYCANDGWKLGTLRVLNGTVRLHALYGVARMLNFGNATNEIDIAEGATLELYGGCTVAGALDAAASAETIVKIGPGTLKIGQSSGLGNAAKTPRSFLLREGALDYQGSSDGIKTTEAFVVGSGRSLSISINNTIENSTVVCVQKGASFTLPTDTLGAIVGEGTATLTSEVRATLPAAKGPFVFSGSMSGTISVSGTATGATRCYVLGSTNAFGGVTFVPVETAVGAEPLLRFLPGVGRFSIGRYEVKTGQPLCLADTNGAPVTVSVNIASTSAAATTGCGSLWHAGTDGSGYAFTGTALAHTGEVWSGASNNSLHLGDNTPGNDVDLSAFSGFGSRYALHFRNGTAQTLGGPVRGVGSVYADGTGALAVPRLDMTDPARFYAAANAAVTIGSLDGSLAYLVAKSNATVRVLGGGGTVGHLQPEADASISVTSFAGEVSDVTYAGTGGAVRFADTDLSAGDTRSIALRGVHDGTSFELTNCQATVSGQWTARNLSFRSSRVRMPGSVGASVGTAQSPRRIFFDDSDLIFGKAAYAAYDSDMGLSDADRVTVGSRGLRLLGEPMGILYGVSVGSLSSAAGTAGPVWVDNGGRLTVKRTWSGLAGPVTFRSCKLESSVAFDLPGKVTLGDVEVGFQTRADFTLASGAGSALDVISSALLRVRPSDKAGISTYAIGPSGAAANSSVTRQPGGVLFVADEGSSSSALDGTSASPVTVNGGLENTAAGITRLPVFSLTNYRADGAQGSRHSLQFMRYDATKGLVEAYGTPWADLATKSADDVVLVDDAAGVKVTEDTTVGGIRAIAASGGRNALEIAAGATLTVGSDAAPTAAVLLNNGNHRGRCILGGAGTLDFGAREGIICGNLAHQGTYPVAVNCTIAGTGGLTFALAQQADAPVTLGATNAYSGVTRVLGGYVEAAKAGCFGTSEVRLPYQRCAYGSVMFTANGTWNNDFRIGGYSRESKYGVLRFCATDTVLAGNVVLEGDKTGVRLNGRMAKGTFAGAISGTGDFIVDGIGTVAFGAANSYAGRTLVHSGATLVVGDGATFGAGAVELTDATLRFENDSDVTVPNAVSGTGRIELAGKGRVTFADAGGFAGAIVAATGAVDLNGTDLATDGLIGSGAYSNSGARATLTAGGTRLAAFAGAIGGAIDFVKTGANDQHLTGASTYSGDTRLSAGTLTLGAVDTTALPVTDAILRLDATAGVAMRAESGEDVGSWSDADGRDVVFTPSTVSGAIGYPKVRADHFNGNRALFFPGKTEPVRLLASGAACAPVTCFGAVAWGHDGAKWENNGGLIGRSGADSGVRSMSDGSYNDQPDYDSFINGARGYRHANGTLHVFARDYGTAQNWASPAVGDYYSTGGRTFGGCVGELVLYGRALNATEIDAVNEYLMVKWGVRSPAAAVKPRDVLPATTHLTVEAGATLNLAGAAQTLAGLDLSGTLESVALKSVGRAVLTLTGASYVRAGAVLRGENIKLVLGPDAVLDLGGGTYSVHDLSGTGRVVNGTLLTLKKGSVLLLK